MRVLFIGGTGRSGSTLMERVLGALPGACALGEVALVWQRALRRDVRCGCGAPFPECDFWTAVGDKAFGGWHQVDVRRVADLHQAVGRNRRIPLLASPRLSRARLAQVVEYADYYSSVYAAAAAVVGASVVIDSSKNPGLAFCLQRARNLDMRIVHLLRDPRGVAYSATKQVQVLDTDGMEMMTRYLPSATAVQWNVHHAAFSLLARLRPARDDTVSRHPAVRRVRYEDFLSDPRGMARMLAGFAGLDICAADLAYLSDFHADLGPGHSVAGNPMRFKIGRVALRRDDAWRTHLPSRQRRIIAAVCAPLLAAYGYPLAIRRPTTAAGAEPHRSASREPSA